MLGVESKPSETDRFKSDSHEKALDKLGYRGLFGGDLGAGLTPSLNASLGTVFSLNDRLSRDPCITSTYSVTRGDRTSTAPLCGTGLGSMGLGLGLGSGGGGCDNKDRGIEMVNHSMVHSIASLILYKCQALPIRLKIPLDRLFSVLTHEEVIQLLHVFGWTYDDYTRGYMLKDCNGSVLHKWNMVTPEEEALLLQQFLRFGETKSIVQQLLQQDPSPGRLERMARDIREAREIRDRDHRHVRDNRDMRDLRSNRDFRDSRDIREFRDSRDDHRREESLRALHHKQSQQHPHQHTLPHQLPDPNVDPEQLKKLLERNMLFNPFLRGSPDPSSLLRPPPPGAPPGLHPTSPLTTASLASNLLAVNPSLASSLLANPQLASSLSMLRLPAPPVSLPNISPSNGSLPVSFGGPTSPLGSSPLNRLQSMQPFDFRKERKSPSPATRTSADMPPSLNSVRPASVVATSPSSIASGGVSLGGTSPSSAVTPLAATTQSNAVSLTGEHDEHPSEDDDSSSVSSVALNLSTTTTTTSPATTPLGQGSVPLPPKSTTPTGGGPPTPPKRSWNPINMGTSLINPVTGKKRVQCNVCLKTFCDKGALKIHFSAVHLREMHKCTVEGCNMMFSSRRSRNRHSANPNPKLHTPHVRRKISPHDGRTSGAHPMMMPPGFQQSLSQGLTPPTGFPPLGAFPAQFGGINPLTGLPFIPHGAAASADLHKQAFELQRQSLEMHALGKNSLDLSIRDDNGWRYGANAISTTTSFPEDGVPLEPSSLDHAHLKREKNGHSQRTSINIDEDDDSMSVDAHSVKGDGTNSPPLANKRKRKNQNPTKFAFRLEDDDLISTDDDDEEDNDDDLDDKDSEDDKNEDKELDAMSDDEDEEVTSNSKTLKNLATSISESAKDGSDSNRITMTYSSYDEHLDTTNALRHLEDLSKGNFTNSVTPNGVVSLGPSAMSSSTNGISSSSPRPSDRESDRDSEGDSPSEELENNLHYTEGGFISNVDIPLDKENPRRCIECGKMFQNHFGVKTHYQNVHLKLMHKCTVDGCNAAFPSKRSRDRHASNLNLHRKLLSTTEGMFPSGFHGMGFPGLPFSPPLNPELLARLYSDPSSLSLEALKSHLPTTVADNPFGSERVMSGSPSTTANNTSPFFLHNLLPHLASSNNKKSKERSGATSPLSITPCTLPLQSGSPPVPVTTPSNNDLTIETRNPRGSSSPNVNTSLPYSESFGTPMQTDQVNNNTIAMETADDSVCVYNLEDDLPTPDREGKMPCRFFYQTFADGDGLKSHYETLHRKELFKCTIDGCHKAFSSRRKRNYHSLNEAAHQTPNVPSDT